MANPAYGTESAPMKVHYSAAVDSIADDASRGDYRQWRAGNDSGAFGSDVDAVLRSLPSDCSRAGRKVRVCVSVCSRLCGVPEQISARVPARDPDRLIKWFIGVVVIGVGVNLLSSFVGAQWWVWLPPAVFVAARLVAVPEYWSSAAGALFHSAGPGHCFARTDRLSGGRGVGIGDWVAPLP